MLCYAEGSPQSSSTDRDLAQHTQECPGLPALTHSVTLPVAFLDNPLYLTQDKEYYWGVPMVCGFIL